ncbi:MAG: restriction endonuclease [Rhodospirillaceae bacterium]
MQIAQEKHMARMRVIAVREEKKRYLEERNLDVEEKNEALEECLSDLSAILGHTLNTNDRIDFDVLRLSEEYPEYEIPDELKTVPPKPIKMLPKPLGFFTKLIPGAKGRHSRRSTQAEGQYRAELAAFEVRIATREQRLAADRQQYEKNRQEFLMKVRQRNAEVTDLQTRYLEGDPDAVVAYNTLVLTRSEYPEGFPQQFRLAYVAESRELVVEYQLPTIQVVPDVESFRYVKSGDRIEAKQRKKGDRKALYQDVVAAVALRTIHEVLEADHHGHVEVVAFNGYVEDIDPATGQPINPCLVSVRTTTDRFQGLDLARIDMRACLRNLGASVSPRPDELQAVKPIVEFDMVDKRFVEQGDVLGELDSRPNLMDLNPFEFENLVSNLFTRMGLDTKLTRSTKDGGVDAVAFDTRPVLGGKVVIQCKRYKDTVGVSAVRDLYGTMLNEGANKGILVCTSGYGRDAFEFSKDKPIELVDGGGLLYLLQQVGVMARIVLPSDA